MSPERIQFLDSLRATAIIMVVGVHTLGYCLPLPERQKSVISFLVLTVSVPVFFLVDGYLFARRAVLSKERSYRGNVRKSLFRLLVPWAIFTLFYTIARYCFERAGVIQNRLIVGHSLPEVAIAAYGSVYAPQLYFLASLFLIRLCGPVFRKLALAKNYASLPLAFLCYYAAYRSCLPFLTPHLKINGGQEPILHALWGIQFYLVGIILLRTSVILDLKRLFAPFLLLFLVVALFRGELGRPGLALSQYLYLMAMFLFFARLGSAPPLLARLGENTMGIYLVHAPIVLRGVSHVLNKFVTVPLWSYLSVLFGAVLVSACIVIAVSRIPYGVLLFGTAYHRGKPAADGNGMQPGT